MNFSPAYLLLLFFFAVSFPGWFPSGFPMHFHLLFSTVILILPSYFTPHSLCAAQLIQMYWTVALDCNSQPWSSLFSSTTSSICSMSNASLDFSVVFYCHHVLIPFFMPASIFEVSTLHPFFRSVLNLWNSSLALHLFCHLWEMYYSLFRMKSPLEMMKTSDFIYWWTVPCWGMVLVKSPVPVKSPLDLTYLHS